MLNKDIIRQMENSGDYTAAREFEDSLYDHGHSQFDRIDRYNPADGAQYTYAGDRAEEAYKDLRRLERKREEIEEYSNPWN